MSRTQPVDPYIDPSSGILRNLLNLQDEQSLALAESSIVAIRDAELIRNPIPGFFGRIHLCAIHRSLFRDVYAWAGQPRTVNIDKGIPFARTEHLHAALDELQPLVSRHGYLHDLDLDATAGSTHRNLWPRQRLSSVPGGQRANAAGVRPPARGRSRMGDPVGGSGRACQ